MNKKEFLVALFFAFMSGIVYGGYKIKVDPKVRWDIWGTSYLFSFPEYIYHNAFDGKINTCWAEGVDGDGSGTNGVMVYTSFEFLEVMERCGVAEHISIGFGKKGFPIEKIVIFNGYCKNHELWKMNNRVKKLGIDIVYKVYNKFGYFYFEKELEDTEREEIEIINYVTNHITGITFFILSTYRGTKYDDTCISEIEFWYKGKKYEVENLEEAKREFLNNLREQVREIITGYMAPFADGAAGVGDSVILVSLEELQARWRKLGIDVDKIDMERFDINEDEISVNYPKAGSYTLCWLRFVGMDGIINDKKVLKDFSGKIVTEGKEKVKGKSKLITIGEWKIDENAVLWIKVGKGEWKRAKRDRWRISTEDTDLGKLALL